MHWALRYAIGNNVKTILDLGCGDGEFMKKLANGEKWDITGVEIYPGSIKKAMKTSIYGLIVKSDVTKLPQSLIKKKFDVVFCSQVIEHLPKKDGIKCLSLWEKIALKRIVIATPVGFIKFHRVEIKDQEDNSYQKHLSGWSPDEFIARGYKVYGQGIKFIYGENGLIRKSPVILWSLLIIISYLFSPISYLFPKRSTYMIAIKDL